MVGWTKRTKCSHGIRVKPTHCSDFFWLSCKFLADMMDWRFWKVNRARSGGPLCCSRCTGHADVFATELHLGLWKLAAGTSCILSFYRLNHFFPPSSAKPLKNDAICIYIAILCRNIFLKHLDWKHFRKYIWILSARKHKRPYCHFNWC